MLRETYCVSQMGCACNLCLRLTPNRLLFGQEIELKVALLISRPALHQATMGYSIGIRHVYKRDHSNASFSRNYITYLSLIHFSLQPSTPCSPQTFGKQQPPDLFHSLT